MSANTNIVIVAGNLVRDPEIKFLANEKQIANFGIANNQSYKAADGTRQEKTYFIECSAFGKTAELIGQYCHKGDPVLVEGQIVQESWEKDGKKQSKTKVKADRVRFLGARSQNKAGSASNGVQTTKAQEKYVGSPADVKDDPPF